MAELLLIITMRLRANVLLLSLKVGYSWHKQMNQWLLQEVTRPRSDPILIAKVPSEGWGGGGAVHLH